MAVLIGVILGLSTLLFIGPVFFYLLKTSIESGFKSGLSVAIGIIIGDIIYVLVVLMGFGKILSSPEYIRWFALFGGVLVLFFGVKYLFFSRRKKKIEEKFKTKSVLYFGLNGFLINFVNPFVLVVWVGFYAYSKTKLVDETSVIVSLLFALVTILSTDILKVFYSNKLGSYFSANNLTKVYKVFGILMICFSIRLFYEFMKS